ncbi:hypothetical protein PHLCEN_2v12114 [Hermanssonia centrifuga]|uniref:Prenyltransferase alpha-alpha toroid domain-containing protein n=1 Tax=Hermanssonia centrifuga TaxID=98765 RepID=A0A2R6NI29_9APHY|nr:hypothetical protein PHLCEN_2v12114 [Hermanssonia centrifuga]
MLGAGDLIDSAALAEFLFKCQFKFGGVRKAPEGSPDPYHTYMAIATLSISPPPNSDESLQLAHLDVLWNTTEDTARWIREHVPVSARKSS